jgi:hypothetical protein
MKRQFIFFLSALLIILLIVWPAPGISQPALKVGALIPYSGRWGDSGRECARGMLDVSKWLNQRGGIFGMKLEVFLIDDTSEPAEFMAAYRKCPCSGSSFPFRPNPHLHQFPTLPICQRVQISLCFLNHSNPARFSKNSNEFHFG